MWVRDSIPRRAAGSGIRHSEVNPSPSEAVRLLQVWILPEARGLEPRHESRRFPIHDEPGRLHLIVSPGGADGSMDIHQDARMHAGVLRQGDSATVELDAGRRAWVQVARGEVRVNGEPLREGDAAALTDEAAVSIESTTDSEVVVFDLAELKH